MVAEASVKSSSLLTPEIKQRIESSGFYVFRQLFPPSEFAEIEAAFQRVIERAAREANWEGTRRLAVVPFVEYDDYFHDLFSDDRINDIVEGLLGPEAIYHGSDGNYYVGNTRWHPDANMYGYPTIKIAFYLDPVGEGSGCLSILPGSHHREYAEGLQQAVASKVYDVQSPDIPGRLPLESQPGDVVVFRHGVWHSSWGGGNRRRMFTINYDASPANPTQNYWLKGLIEIMNSRKGGYQLYNQRFVDRVGPRGQARLAKLIEQGYCADTLKPFTQDVLFFQHR